LRVYQFRHRRERPAILDALESVRDRRYCTNMCSLMNGTTRTD
jgi:hypothetical protein